MGAFRPKVSHVLCTRPYYSNLFQLLVVKLVRTLQCDTLSMPPQPPTLNWVAVKKLKLRYHNGLYIVNNRVSPI